MAEQDPKRAWWNNSAFRLIAVFAILFLVLWLAAELGITDALTGNDGVG